VGDTGDIEISGDDVTRRLTLDDEKNDSKSSNFSEQTKIDLGEDLLEHTVVLPGFSEDSKETKKEEDEEPKDLDDLFRSAEILVSEGFSDEAKKILREILRVEPNNVSARSKLDEIHETELAQILKGGAPSPQARYAQVSAQPEEDFSQVNTEEVMRRLDWDLKLGIFPDQVVGQKRESETEEETLAERALFSSPEEIEEYGEKLEKQLVKLSAQDRLDIGIAFFEMGLFDLAVRQFRAVRRLCTGETDQERLLFLSSSVLLASSQLSAGKAFEAVLTLESIIGDAGYSTEEKIHFFYLMGVASEDLGHSDQAIQWYRQTEQIDPGYRDVQRRLKGLKAE